MCQRDDRMKPPKNCLIAHSVLPSQVRVIILVTVVFVAGLALPASSVSGNMQSAAPQTILTNPSSALRGDYQPPFPIRAAFYYPWFPEAWNQQGFNPFTNYTPSLGYYDSGAVDTLQSPISGMHYGNIHAV